MANFHTTLTSLFSDIADAIRRKTGGTSDLVADDFPLEIDSIPTGTPLPTLTDPASASDVLDGKEVILPDANEQPVKVTGTLVPPVDTGANGLYKALLCGDDSSLPSVISDLGITELNSTGRTYIMVFPSAVKEAHFPNLNTLLGSNRFFRLSDSFRIMELGSNAVISSGPGSVQQGFIGFDTSAVSPSIKIMGVYRFNERSLMQLIHVLHQWFSDVQQIDQYVEYANAGVRAKTVTFDSVSSINGRGVFGTTPNSTLAALIIRTPNLCTLTSAFTFSDISAGFTKIYVPKLLESSYKSATNWTALSNQIYGIDEDTNCAVNATFTPSYVGSEVTHWDQVNCQEYSVGTVDSSTGTITPTTDGRILIRGLDANDEIKYVVYLVIGTGLDTEATV